MTDFSNPIIRDGTDQDQRLPGALEDGYFNVDETPFEGLAAMGAEFSDSLHYYRSDNRASGTWKSMFTSDEALVFAMILSFNLNAAQTWFTRLSRQKDVKNLARLNYRMAVRINGWYENLLTIDSGIARTCCLRIRHLIEKQLAAGFTALEETYSRFNGKGISDGGLNPVWSGRAAGPDEARAPGAKTPEAESSAEDAPGSGRLLDRLTEAFYGFHSGIAYIQKEAGVLMEDSLKSGNHNPSAGLFLTFLRLFKRVQADQNRFTRRHTDFYYREVLKCRHLPPVPDRVWLLFKKAPRTRDAVIPRGTLFSAGSDTADPPRTFASDRDLRVTDARVAALKTLFYKLDSLTAERISGARVRSLPVNEPITDTGWPVFGAPESPGAGGDHALLGFALSGPVLLLREGEREVTVSLDLDRFRPDTQKKEAPPIFSGFLAAEARRLKTTAKEIFSRIIPGMFRISLTTAGGWFDVGRYLTAIKDSRQRPREPSKSSSGVDSKPDSRQRTLELSFELDAGMPAVSPWSRDLHGGGYETSHPVIRFALNPEAYAYPCTMLQDYYITEARIRVRVTGLKDLRLYNQLGPLDANSPFQPFGPLPAVGVYFIAGAWEMSVKQVRRFHLDLEWGGLPRGKGGFGSYYAAYGGGINNHSFKTKVSILRDGLWQAVSGPANPAADQGRILFREQAQGKLAGTTRLAVAGIDGSKGNAVPEDAFGFDARTRSGFFKFTLTAPEQAFGHRDYPFLLTDTLTYNARRGRFIRPKAMPNPAYVPTINGLTAGYTAETVIRPDLSRPDRDTCQDQVFSLHPFGLRRVFPLQQQRKWFLVPDYHKQGRGNLFIGLTALEPEQRLTLFFHLGEDARAISTQAIPVVKWYSLSRGQWKELSKEQVVADTTGGFLTSGIVILDLPAQMDRSATLFEEDLYWIRACANDHLAGASSLLGVQAHAVSATLRMPASGPTPAGILAAGSIDQSLSRLPGIAAVIQPLPAFGGRLPEDDTRFNTRMGERLKHKNRAVTPWDFERLILQQFPELFKVKCFPGIHSDTWRSPEPPRCPADSRASPPDSGNGTGRLLIAVIPRFDLKNDGMRQDPRPMASPILLNRIKAYVCTLASAFADVEVRNPAYERIMIRCTVCFNTRENLWGNKRRLNRAICEFISPWTRVGYPSRFGWRIRRSDIIAHIQKQPYVSFVTNYSMLRIAGTNGNRFDLFDSIPRDTSSPPQNELGPRVPWSIAVNAARHFIQTTGTVKPIRPDPTGLEELELGETFIIGG